ncbi:MAG: dTDP-4-amino-4,6-dideoxygalactose transaminase [Rhodobacteraceae bacterium]|nr:dTDP-4-amino-4,6-dideoxygalactose transaminase [Paracoccaceae bacterium]
MQPIPYHRPYFTGFETQYLTDALGNGQLSGDGRFTKNCHHWLETQTQAQKALLTHSCTASLEMAALLIDVRPGDEIIMPSFTFVSTANAFVLRGGIPVFVDIREDTLNLDETKIEAAITKRTKAIVPVHYAGVACEMDTILDIAKRNNVRIIEDAAQGVVATYKKKPLGSIGDLGSFSFHDTKNIISGEGGALLINRDEFIQQAEIIREKGTNRSRFFRGEVDKYTWQDVGSSFLPSELTAAFLYAQLEHAEQITKKRLAIWNRYNSLTEELECEGLIKRPGVPPECEHNGHIFYVLLAEGLDRKTVLDEMKQHGVHAVFHYIPLHSAPAGEKFGRSHGDLSGANRLSESIIRLPLWVGMTDADQERVIAALKRAIEKASAKRAA